ncbi:hypothetical protein L9F63_011816, partial [Diploptera punctata]
TQFNWVRLVGDREQYFCDIAIVERQKIKTVLGIPKDKVDLKNESGAYSDFLHKQCRCHVSDSRQFVTEFGEQ